MAMNLAFIIRETHTRAITAVGYHVARREIMIGCEDGVVKSFQYDTGSLVNSYNAHLGWVTDFIYWSENKLVLSAGHDGSVIMWGAGGGITDKIQVGEPVYCLALNYRRRQLICGVFSCIKAYAFDEDKDSSHFIYPSMKVQTREHTDIVKCVVCFESRVYSAGFDQQLIIYESTYNGMLKPLVVNNPAHDAGITCLNVVKDNECQIWIITGSYDKTVKIWSSDGKLVHQLDGFITNVTGLCYVPCCRVLWAAGGTPNAYLYEVKSGDNVSDFVDTFQSRDSYSYQLQLLKFFSDPDQVIAKKVPILLFTGDVDGTLTKWERMQFNTFTYSKEMMLISDTHKAKKRRRKDREKEDAMREIIEKENLSFRTDHLRHRHRPKSEYSHIQPTIPKLPKRHSSDLSILRLVFVEDLDLLIAACENGRIYVWGFDEDAVKALRRMGRQQREQSKAAKQPFESPILIGKKFDILRSSHNPARQTPQSPKQVSGGWDRRLCVWDLESGTLQDTFRNQVGAVDPDKLEIASDGIILDMAYCPVKNQIAYSTSENNVFIRKFSTNGSFMTLVNVLRGHYGEVVAVEWNSVRNSWVTGSEDGTIRIWSCEPGNECEQILSAHGSVTALCIDKYNGAIIAGVQQFIRVYDTEHYRLIQTNEGHSDAVRSILHVPERNQYISTSWDKTIRIWNAWRPPMKKKTTDRPQTSVVSRPSESRPSIDSSSRPRSTDDAVVDYKAPPTINTMRAATMPMSTSVAPSVPPNRSTLKISSAERARLAALLDK